MGPRPDRDAGPRCIRATSRAPNGCSLPEAMPTVVGRVLVASGERVVRARSRHLGRWTAVLALWGALASCGDGRTGPDPADAVASIEVRAESDRAAIGTPLRLSVTIRNGRAEELDVAVSWSTSAPQVATVDASGTVSAVAPGSVVITARVDDVFGSVSLEAFDPNPPLPPGDVVAEAITDREVELRWSDNSNSETRHTIRREAVGGAAAGGSALVQIGTAGPNATSFRDTGLLPDTRYRYTLEACNEAGCSVGAAAEAQTYLTLGVDASPMLPDALLGVVYDWTLSSTGPEASWSLLDGVLPAGVTLSAAGRLEGTPSELGDFVFTLSADGGGQSVATEFRLRVFAAPEVRSATLPTGVRTEPFESALVAAGGDGGFEWRLVGGALPAGLSLDTDGVISGVPVETGAFGFTVEVETVGLTARASLELRVYDPLEISTGSVASAVVHTAYDVGLGARGGDGVYLWTLTGGSLPEGLGLSSDGVISGTPTSVGTAEVSVGVTSGDGQSATASLTLVVNEQIVAPVVSTATLPLSGVGAPYAASLHATEGDGSYQWTLVSGSLPPGIELAGDGTLSGTPTAAGSFSFRMRVTSGGLSGVADLDLTVIPGLSVGPATLPTAVVGAAYAASFVATGGDGAPIFTIVSGSLPTGITLDGSTGQMSGSAQSAGAFDFSVKLSNAVGQSVEAPFRIESYSPLAITGADPPDGNVSVSYSHSLQASGGDGNHSWSLVGGSLPGGIALGTGGALTGTPNQTGTFDFTVRVVSGDSQSSTRAFSILVGPSPPSIVTSGLPSGTVDVAYSYALTASGGDGSYLWSVQAGALPNGVTLDPSTGVVGGTPTESGLFNITFAVASAGQSASRGLALIVSNAPVVFARSYLPGGYRNVAYSALPESATGGSGTYVYSITAGALPAGLSLDSATGRISGVPTGSGMAYFELTATSGGASASVVFGLTISGAVPGAMNVFGVNVADVIPSPGMRSAIDAALARFEAAITGDAPDVVLPASGLESSCSGNGALLHGRAVDDIVILMDIGPIDGPGGIAGQAGICGLIRDVGPFAVTAQLVLDSDDVDGFSPTVQFALVWHEIGHGFGLIEGAWVALGLMTGEDGPSPEYTGAGGVAAFQGIPGATGNPPIEADGGGGTRDSHWDEGFFDTEMMTGFLDPLENSLSVLTIAALGDLGWSGIDLGAADPYSIPGCSPGCSVTPPAPAAPVGDSRIPLLDDVLGEDIFTRSPDGRLVRIEWNPASGRR